MEPLRVVAVGSCRVFRPLRAAHAAGHIDLLNRGLEWFTHSAGEAVQYVDVVRGARDLPEALRPLICETDRDLPADLSSPWVLHADVAVVEVSTLKVMELDGYRLNYHKVWGYAQERGYDTRAVLSGVVDGLPDDEPLRRVKVSKATADEVGDTLETLRRTARVPVLAVDHLYATLPSGDLAPERAALRDALQEVQGRHGIPVWSTRPFIAEHGPSVLEDHNHWAKDAEDRVGEDLTVAALTVSREARQTA